MPLPTRTCLSRFARRLPRAQLKLFPDADHSFHVQVLGELLDALAAWVGGLGKGDAI